MGPTKVEPPPLRRLTPPLGPPLPFSLLFPQPPGNRASGKARQTTQARRAPIGLSQKVVQQVCSVVNLRRQAGETVRNLRRTDEDTWLAPKTLPGEGYRSFPSAGTVASGCGSCFLQL